jgi:uncharacterized membrane protein
MSWSFRKRLLSFLKSSLWVTPAFSTLCAVLSVPLLRILDRSIGFHFFRYTPDGARAVASIVSSAMLSFVVLFFSVLLLTVQIASSSLSPANHILLREVGRRRLDPGKAYDSNGKLRLAYRTPDWDDFVSLAVTEIRQFGGNSTQVARRMRAMLQDLILSLPEERGRTLHKELDLLKYTVDQRFTVKQDRLRAEAPDSQGLVGKQKHFIMKKRVTD